MRWAWICCVGLLASCGADKDGRRPAVACSIEEPCEGDDVCYANFCFDPGDAFTDVLVDIQPRTSSGVPRQLYHRAINLAEGEQRLLLRDAVRVQGEVQAPGAGILPGALRFTLSSDASCGNIAFGDVGEERIPVGAGGEFEGRILPDHYLVTFEPSDASKGPPVRVESPSACGTSFDEDVGLTVTYPPLEDLVHLRGTLRYSSTVAGAVEGAQVWGTALDASGEAQVRSNTVTTSEAGAFELAFPPGAHAFKVSARAGEGVVLMASWDVTPAGSDAGALAFGVGPNSKVTITVLAGGAPVAGATVALSGDAATAPTRTSLSARAQTSMSGVAELNPMRPGAYRVTVAPPPTTGEERWAQTTATLVVPEATTLEVSLAPQTRVFGYVESAAGYRVPGARVTYTLRDSPILRSFTTLTDGSGSYTLWVDPFAPDQDLGAAYTIDVAPPPETGEPWHRAQVRVEGNDQLVPLTLLPATFLYGTLLDPTGSPLGLASLSAYSPALGSPSAPLLVGTTTSDEHGVFALPLPSPE